MPHIVCVTISVHGDFLNYLAVTTSIYLLVISFMSFFKSEHLSFVNSSMGHNNQKHDAPIIERELLWSLNTVCRKKNSSFRSGKLCCMLLVNVPRTFASLMSVRGMGAGFALVPQADVR